ncbi:MAG: DUF1700 domain-containing protein [Clostridiales Family XIII bacterium]|jgi:uncharacterized membrane protein|nr:DUF1700 domain-containing protein [Clostridiales Family XIII bacterium]
MTMNEYIEELKYHLRKMPDDDREDAIEYYFEYLAEAGPEGEAAAIERLGTPQQLAAGIRADAALEALEGGASTRQIQDCYRNADDDVGAASCRPPSMVAQHGGSAKAPGVGQGVKAVWLSVLGAIPRNVLAGFVAGIVIIIVFAVLIGLFAAAVAIMAVGACAIGVSFTLFGETVAAGLFYLGCGLALVPIGWFLWRGVWWVWRHAWRGIAKMFNGIRRKREVRRVAK